jgi:regulator of sigma E protease
VLLEVQRKKGDSSEIVTLPVAVDNEGKLGVFHKELVNYSTRQYSIGQSIIKGIQTTTSMIRGQFQGTARLVIGSINKSTKASGPISIAKAFASPTDWHVLLNWIAYYAVLGIFWNLMPFPKSALLESIPIAYEQVSGKPLSFKVIDILKKSSYALIVLLILWIFVNDISKLF